ncbi:MAG: hypothetical protein LW875_03810 [Proteobacteria bacterium]|jgi:hypothetical protein|nr:hypothetical protein [Pseudomonadota bacterium]
MKALNQKELESLVLFLNEKALGSQLQKVWTFDQGVVLELYREQSHWVVIDLRQQLPFLLWLSEEPRLHEVKKPVALFLNSHAKNLRVCDIRIVSEKGRVLQISFGSGDRQCLLEAILIPRAGNLKVEKGEKSIWWEKPTELSISPLQQSFDLRENLDFENLFEEFQNLYWRKKPSGERGDPRPKDLEKKRNALVRLQTQNLEKDISRYLEMGELLKYEATVPEVLKDLWRQGLSVSENRERAFAQAKDLRLKLKGQTQRQLQLQAEIEKIERDLQENPIPKTVQLPSKTKGLLEKAEAKGRKKVLASGLVAVMGKSAADNLSILRRAQAWDLWIHLKDFPSAYAVLSRNRNQNVSQGEILEVARWLVQEFESKKQKSFGKLDVLVAECRHVKPIKGDKIGRVTYHNAQVYTLASNRES